MFLRVRDLRSGYGRTDVLHGVRLDLDQGRALALLGRNGAGKTTLVMTIMGLLRPSAGSVQIGGRELAGSRPDRIARAGVALVPQGRRLWPGLTVAEHLTLAVRRRPVGTDGRRWSVESLFELLPVLATRRSQQAGLLSGGEQQMLALARALLTNPALLLLDEPSEGLAPAMVDRVGEVIKAVLAEGVAVLLVEQDLHLVFAVADDVAVLAKGSFVHRARTDAFRRDPDTARRLLGVAA
jgi:branched-chain amino acid transport system ATP-binding protein